VILMATICSSSGNNGYGIDLLMTGDVVDCLLACLFFVVQVQ